MRVYKKAFLLTSVLLVSQLLFIYVVLNRLEESEHAVDAQILLAEQRELAYLLVSRCHRTLLVLSEQAINQDFGLDSKVQEQRTAAREHVNHLLELSNRKSARRLPRLKEEFDNFDLFVRGIVALNQSRARFSNVARHGIIAASRIRNRKLTDALSPLYQNQSETDSRFMEVRAKNIATLRTWIWYGIGLNMFLAASICFAFSIDFVKRIKHLNENSLRLSKGRELLPALGGSDEIAQLDGLFHTVGTIFRQSFNRETSMFDSAADLIVCLDSQGKIERINRVFSESLAYATEASEGAEIFNFIFEEDRDLMRSFLNSAKKGGQGEDIELRMLTSTGDILDYQWAVHWEPGYDSFYCVAHDTTERKRLEQAKQDFVAMLSHDLRSPLTALSITIDFVVQGAAQNLPDKCIELFKLSEKSVVRLINLINELLDLEKLEAGEMEITLNAVPISRIVAASIESLKASASANGVQLVANASDDLAVVDEQRLSRALINLISNAIKYSEKDSEVRIDAKRIHGMVEVRVTDFGPGIQPDYLKQIFDRYKQIEDTQNIHKQGTGLGLSIFKAIIDAHGGVTGVESTVGKGSTFWFRVKGCD